MSPILRRWSAPSLTGRLLLLSLLLAGLLSQPLRAEAATPSDSHQQAALELLEVMQSKRMLDQSVEQVDAMVRKQLTGMVGELNQPEYQSALNEYSSGLKKAVGDVLNWDELRISMARLYTNVYTEQELREVTAFYRTPAGAKFIDKMPALMQETMTLMQGQIQQLLPQIMQLAQKLQKDVMRIRKEKEQAAQPPTDG